MKKRIILPLAILAVVGISAAIFWCRSSPPVLALLPANQHVAQRWSWNFLTPESSAGLTYGLQLTIRGKETMPLVATARATAPFSAAASPCDSTVHVGVIGPSAVGKTELQGTATIQLLNLDDLSANSTEPKKTLRILATLSVGGTTINLGSRDTILAGTRITNTSVDNEGTWKNGELHLMNFVSQGDGCQYEYAVFLELVPDRTTR